MIWGVSTRHRKWSLNSRGPVNCEFRIVSVAADVGSKFGNGEALAPVGARRLELEEVLFSTRKLNM